ncbi:MAG: TIGR00730 family Rossman fold protein [Planctomycetes bacterium]|nr:TIGR00730 family Rossman fold protein [Planctomycetota bacterium]
MLGGPRPRLEEFFRILRIATEFIRGFRKLHFVGPCVTVFGSARFDEKNGWYQLARQVGSELGRRGFTVMTGGGPGIMEAANRGARDVNAPSIGCNIKLPHEQIQNAYCDRTIWFQYFFIRKVMLVKYSYGFVVMPGGFGTLDEFFEAITLVQTKKIDDFPVVLMGRAYWDELFDFVNTRLVPAGTISPTDTLLYKITDDPVEAADYISEPARLRFGLKHGEKPRRKWWLFE